MTANEEYVFMCYGRDKIKNIEDRIFDFAIEKVNEEIERMEMDICRVSVLSELENGER